MFSLDYLIILTQVIFLKNEILEIFSDFTTISIIDEYSLDIEHGTPHYHGLIKYIGKK